MCHFAVLTAAPQFLRLHDRSPPLLKKAKHYIVVVQLNIKLYIRIQKYYMYIYVSAPRASLVHLYLFSLLTLTIIAHMIN